MHHFNEGDVLDTKEFLINELTKISDISSKFQEKVCLNDLYEDENNEEIIEVNREIVIDYLLKSGFDLTDENFKQAEKMLVSMESGKRSKTLRNAGKAKEFTTINHLNSLSTEELSSLLNIAILNVLNEIKEKRNVKYEYAVETINDIRGSTNITALKYTLKSYGDRGYKVKSIFTNELGKNSISAGTFGINSTEDEVVIVFEKVIYD